MIKYSVRGLFTRGLFTRGTAIAAILMMGHSNAMSMDLAAAIKEALRTNPEIGEAAANKRAIDFEYQQARQIGNPHVILEGRAGPSWIDSRTSRLFDNDDEVLFARQASVIMQKNLMSFGRNEAEQDRQASRVDSASHRVYERSEFVGLDVAQSYFDILRLRKILTFADKNVAFHQQMADDLTRGVNSGIVRETDSLQAQERLASSKISRSEVEESHDLAMAKFAQLVGYDVGEASVPPTFEAVAPRTLENALSIARSNNPTIKIAYADLDVARANYRAAKAETKPELSFEVSGRTGEHTDSFRDTNTDLRAQVVLKYEFRGGIKNSAVQEHLNWVDEQRQRVMTIERNVDNLVRNAWITRTKMQMRVKDLEQRVATGEKLRSDYQRERVLGNRSLLDILNAQEDLFQAQSSLVTAEFANQYANYRLLASTGQLLEAFGFEPPRESKANLRDYQGVPLTPAADTEKRKHPKHYFDTTTKNWNEDGVRMFSEWRQENQKQVTQEIFALSKDVKPIFKTEASQTIVGEKQSLAQIKPVHSAEKTSSSNEIIEYGSIVPVKTVTISEQQPVQISLSKSADETSGLVESYLAKTGATPVVSLDQKAFEKLSQRTDLQHFDSLGVISGDNVIYVKTE